MRSLEARLNATLLAGTGLLMLLAGGALDRLVSQGIRREHDRSLEALARGLVAASEQSRGTVEVDFSVAAMPGFGAGREPDYFQLWFASGRVLGRSPSLGARDLARAPVRSGQPRFSDVTLPDGRKGRQVELDFVPQVEPFEPEDVDDEEEEDEGALMGFDPPAAATGAKDDGTARHGEEDENGEDGEDDEDDEDAEGEEGKLPAADGAGASPVAPAVRDAAPLTITLAVARGRGPLDATLRIFRISLGATAAGLLAGMALLVRLATRHGLSPLSDMARQVGELEPHRLEQRVTAPASAAELAPLVDKLNDLLRRLAEAFERERRFSSDLAHELRTPVAELRTLAEVGKRWPDDRAAIVGFLGDTLAIALQMEEIIESLLSLARCEAGIERVLAEPVDLKEALGHSWSPLEARARERGVTFRLDAPADAIATTDARKLDAMLRCLLGNAVAYSPEGAEVRAAVRREGGRTRLSISNPAPHLGPEDLGPMFERFWRKDPARSGGGHTGLGLSIVRAFAKLLGIELEPSLAGDGRLTVSLLFPPR